MLLDIGGLLLNANDTTDVITPAGFVSEVTSGGGPQPASLQYNVNGSVTIEGTGSGTANTWGRPIGGLTGTYHMKWEPNGTTSQLTVPFASGSWQAMSGAPYRFAVTASSSSAITRYADIYFSDDGGSTTLVSGTLTLLSDDTP